MSSYNPTRRNRNIGTAKSGLGQDNRLTIPRVFRGEHDYWERIERAQRVIRTIAGRALTFYVQPTRADCVHACTVDDIARLISLVPTSDWDQLNAIVLRQPRRKEQTLASVWGRLCYATDLVDARGQVLYQGPAIVIEAVNPTEPIKFGKSLSMAGRAELERLHRDGHKIRPSDRYHSIVPSLESCRATQLYRTVLHELGHWVDFLEKVERPAAATPNNDDYGALLERFHKRPHIEKETFAHSYAEKLSRRLLEDKAIPFERQLDREQLSEDGLRWEDFQPNTCG